MPKKRDGVVAIYADAEGALKQMAEDGAVSDVGSGGGNGGSTPGAMRLLGPFQFAFDTPGLADGVQIATLEAGDVLYDVLFAFTTPWNGTTPLADISLSDGDFGVFGQSGPGAVSAASGPLSNIGPNTSILFPNSYIASIAVATVALNIGPLASAIVASAEVPVKVVVSQTGVTGGAAPGADQGAGFVYLVVSTPSLT